MNTYTISGWTRPSFTYMTYPTWWRRLFNRPVMATYSYYHRVYLVVESDVPLNNLRHAGGNLDGPQIEAAPQSTPYIRTEAATVSSVHTDLTEDEPKQYAVEVARTNLLTNTDPI